MSIIFLLSPHFASSRTKVSFPYYMYRWKSYWLLTYSVTWMHTFKMPSLQNSVQQEYSVALLNPTGHMRSPRTQTSGCPHSSAHSWVHHESVNHESHNKLLVHGSQSLLVECNLGVAWNKNGKMNQSRQWES